MEFKSLYSFLSQVVPYDDSELEKLYTFARNLLTKLPKREERSGYEPGEDVALKYYRLQKIAQGAIDLRIGEPPPVYGAKEVGTGSVDEQVPLSTLIETLNERFRTEFTVADQLFFEQVKETAMNNEELIGAARANTLENFKYVFDKLLESLFVERMDGNEEIFARLMNDDAFKKVAARYLAQDVYDGILTKEGVE